MTKYNVVITELFEEELDQLIDATIYQYDAPLSAERYFKGIMDQLKNLEIIAGSLPYARNKYIVDRYGSFCKRLNYKKISILFYVNGCNVYLISILPQSGIYGV